MVAHMAGNAGGPPPPSEREARLEAELRAAREAQRVDRLLIAELRSFIERNHGNRRQDEYWQALVNARSSLNVYDKVAGEVDR